IRKAFAEAGICDDTAADMLGVSNAILCEMFEGRVRCAPVALLLIAGATDKSVSWFFTDECATH
ncbi:MAG: hypothetical protein RL291_1106, partial [Pseudomonadota bacterium]